MKKARIVGGVAVDVLPAEAVPVQWLDQFEDVPDEVLPQWQRLPEIVAESTTANLVWRAPGTIVDEYETGKFRYAQQGKRPELSGPRMISAIAFRNRFTAAEKVAYEMAALDNPAASAPARQASAGLRAALQDVLAAKGGIDLTSATTQARVLALEAAGVLAAGRARQIIDAPVQPDELP